MMVATALVSANLKIMRSLRASPTVDDLAGDFILLIDEQWQHGGH